MYSKQHRVIVSDLYQLSDLSRHAGGWQTLDADGGGGARAGHIGDLVVGEVVYALGLAHVPRRQQTHMSVGVVYFHEVVRLRERGEQRLNRVRHGGGVVAVRCGGILQRLKPSENS